MSFSKKCDFCGKIEKSGASFSAKTFTLVLQNHCGEKYEVTADVSIQLSSDAKAIKDFNDNKNGLAQDLIAKALMGGVDPNTSLSDLLQMKNPNPHVCDACKKVLITYVANYCQPGKVETF